jgi:hypothetical protein
MSEAKMKAMQLKLDARKERIEELEKDLYEVRLRSALVLRAIMRYLGLPHWPTFKGDFIEGVCGLLQRKETGDGK